MSEMFTTDFFGGISAVELNQALGPNSNIRFKQDGASAVLQIFDADPAFAATPWRSIAAVDGHTNYTAPEA